MKMDYFPSPQSVSIASLANATIMSNSEIQSWHECERRHFYAHVLKLEPKNYSLYIQRGFLGHECLAEYYTAMQDGKSKDECHKAAVAPIDRILIPLMGKTDFDTEQLKMLTNLKSIIMQYVLRYHEEDTRRFNIIEIETIHIVPTPIVGLQFGMKLDLLVEHTQPPSKGELSLRDHKFVKRFKNKDVIQLLPQIPRYMAVARSSNKYPVALGTLNMLKHSAQSDIFRQEPINPTDERLDEITNETFLVMQRIAERTSLPVETQDVLALRTRSETVCGYCPFRKICTAESDHGSIFSERGRKNGMAQYFLDEYYQENSYGYSFEEDKADVNE